MRNELTIFSILFVFLSFGQEVGTEFVVGNPINDDVQFNNINDSLLKSFSSSVNSINFPNKEELFQKRKRDTLLEIDPKFPKVTGQIDLGFEYGLLTGYVNPETTDPLKVFNTRGDLSVEAFQLPFQFSYNYSTFRNPLGVNNYFRVSLDTERLKQLASQRKSESLNGLNNSIEKLESTKEAISGKIGMGEVLMQKISRDIDVQKNEMDKYLSEIESSASNNNAINNLDPKEISTNQLTESLLDSVETQDSKQLDSLRLKYDRALNGYNKSLQLYDTISKLYDKVLTIYTAYSDLQEQLNAKKELVNGYSNKVNSTNAESQLGEKKESFLQNIKTLDFGLTYPKTSALSKNSVPVQGLNFEFQRKKMYFGFCAGVTMNNLMVSTDVVQNKLNNSKNLFNQFDFQNIQQRGFLTSVKSGYGTKESSHALVGIRYLTNSSSALNFGNDSTIIPSLAAEIDLRWAPTFAKGLLIDFVYGKSSSYNSLIDSTRTNVLSSLASSDRTNTALLKISQQIEPIRTEIEGSFRWLDPLADTRSLGVLQPNNVRYEIRSRSTLAKRIKIGLTYRHDQNNIGNLSDTTLSLNVVGGQLNGNITKAIHYFGSLNYLTQYEKSSIASKNTVNYIYGAGISAEYRVKKVPNSLTLSYDDYLISDTASTGLFRNITIQNSAKFRIGINTLSAKYFRMNDPLLPSNSSIIIGDQFSFQTERFDVQLGVRFMSSDAYETDFGGNLKVDFRINKNISWLVEGRKLLLGDFYNYYSRERFDRFPYVIMTRIKYSFN